MDNNKVNKKLENFKGFFKPKGEKSKEVIEAADSTAVNRKGFFTTCDDYRPRHPRHCHRQYCYRPLCHQGLQRREQSH